MCLRVDMRRALDQLSKLERKAVLLISLGELTVREAAETLGIPRSNCHRIHRSTMRKLRRQLQPHREP